MVKRDTTLGKFSEQAHLARANSLEQGQKQGEHHGKVWGEAGEGLSVEQKAKHLAAAAAHGAAEHHFGQAARAFEEERPMAAKEHLALAENHKAEAEKLSREIK